MDDLIFWEQGEYIGKINNNLTKKQALTIIKEVSLHCRDREDLIEDLEELKMYIKSK